MTQAAETPTFPALEVAQAVGARPVTWEVIESGGYGRVNVHWRAAFADGRTAFVKHALTETAAEWLRKEGFLYESVSGSFMPTYLGSHDRTGTTLLVLEDLTAAEWPPPWSPARVEAVLQSLDALHRTRPPDGLEALDAMRESIVGWGSVEADPEPLIGTGLCSRSWLRSALPLLLDAGQEAQLGGSDLLHFDVRSDNLCFAGGRALLVDWNLACRGNGTFDIAFWLPSLALEGGPKPWELLRDAWSSRRCRRGFLRRTGWAPAAGRRPDCARVPASPGGSRSRLGCARTRSTGAVVAGRTARSRLLGYRIAPSSRRSFSLRWSPPPYPTSSPDEPTTR